MNVTRKLFTREGFLTMVTAAFSGLAGIAVGIPVVGYLIGPLLDQPKNNFQDARLVKADGSLGDIVTRDTIPRGQTEQVVFQNAGLLEWAGSTAKNSAWLRHNRPGEPTEFTAYSIFCTHLGCPIKWLSEPKIFLCPCHGSVFNADGTVAGGPAPQSLFQYEWRILQGRVQIKTQHLPIPSA